jgi:hypothetical protein
MLPQQFAITEVCWKGWKNDLVGPFIIIFAFVVNIDLNDLIHIAFTLQYVIEIDQTVNKFLFLCRKKN